MSMHVGLGKPVSVGHVGAYSASPRGAYRSVPARVVSSATPAPRVVSSAVVGTATSIPLNVKPQIPVRTIVAPSSFVTSQSVWSPRKTAPKIRAALGSRLPSVELDFGFPPEKVNIAERSKGKRIFLVGLPGAFTPT